TDFITSVYECPMLHCNNCADTLPTGEVAESEQSIRERRYLWLSQPSPLSLAPMTRLGPLLGFCLLLAPLPAAAAGSYVTLSENDCARLARHYPDPGVAYQPGRDVRGKAVAPADLAPNGGLILPDAVVIPIEVELFERY